MKRFNPLEREQKLAALLEATHSANGISRLYEGLEDDDLKVRSFAYEQLKIIGETSAELERGIPIRNCDHIYAVYQSKIFWDGDMYYIDIENSFNSPGSPDPDSFHTKEDSAGNIFEYLSDSPDDNLPRIQGKMYLTACRYLFAYCLDKLAAQAKKEEAYIKAFAKLPCRITSIVPDRKYYEYVEIYGQRLITKSNFDPGIFNLESWVEENGIVIEDKLKAKLSGWDEYNQLDYGYSLAVIESLYNQKRFDLLRGIWPLVGHKPMAYICEYSFHRPYYLQIHSK